MTKVVRDVGRPRALRKPRGQHDVLLRDLGQAFLPRDPAQLLLPSEELSCPR